MEKIIYEYIESYNKNYLSFERKIQEILKIQLENMTIYKKEKIKNALKNLRKNPKLIKDPILVNDKIREIISKLFTIKIIESLDNIEKLYNSHQESIKSERKLNILTIGGYSSGKSTLLNTIVIGNNILPTSSLECTKIGLIIKHCDSISEIGLYEIEFKTEDIPNGYYYYKYDKDKPIKKNIEDIIKHLNQLNQDVNENNEIKIYLLLYPFKLFEYIEENNSIKKAIKNDEYELKKKIKLFKEQIQFIDYPGLDTDFKEKFKKVYNENNKLESKFDPITNALLNYTNGFLFVNNGIQILEHSNKELLNNILIQIKNKQNNFSFKNCLFIMNKCDEADINIKKSKADFVELISNIQKSSVSLKERMYRQNEIKSNNDLNITKFSSYKFNDYLKLNNKKSNAYKVSNGEHLFKSLYQIMQNSIGFYNDVLQIEEIDFLEKLYNSFSEILNSINIESNSYDSDIFIDKKEKDIKRKEIADQYEEFEKRIFDKIYQMELIIKSKIGNMRENKTKRRGDFTKIVTEIGTQNEKILNDNKEEINKLISEMAQKMNSIIQELKDLANGKKKQKIQNYSKELRVNEINTSLTTNFTEEENIAEKFMDSTYFKISSFIPYWNIGTWVGTVGWGLFDSLRDHSEEYERKIKKYEEDVYDSISEYKAKIRRNINKMIFDTSYNIENLFLIYGNDLKEIKKNKDCIVKVIQEFEDYIIELSSK